MSSAMESSVLIWSVLLLLVRAGDPNVKEELELPNTGEGEGLAVTDVHEKVGPGEGFADAAVNENAGPDEAPVDPKNGLDIVEAAFDPKTEAAVEADEVPKDPKAKAAVEAVMLEVDEVLIIPKRDEVPFNPKVIALLETDVEPVAVPKTKLLLEEEDDPKEKPLDRDFEVNEEENVAVVVACPNKPEELGLKKLGSEEGTVPEPNEVLGENSLAAEDKPKELLVEAAAEVDGSDEEDGSTLWMKEATPVPAAGDSGADPVAVLVIAEPSF